MAAVQSLPGYAGMNDGIPVQPTQAAPSAPEKKPKKEEGGSALDQGKLENIDADTGMFKTFLIIRCAEI